MLAQYGKQHWSRSATATATASFRMAGKIKLKANRLYRKIADFNADKYTECLFSDAGHNVGLPGKVVQKARFDRTYIY